MAPFADDPDADTRVPCMHCLPPLDPAPPGTKVERTKRELLALDWQTSATSSSLTGRARR